MDISGTMRIYKSEFDGKETYSTTVSKKDQFGNYENMYVAVQLPRDVSLDNNSRINVTKGFLSFFKNKQGLPKLKMVVQQFDVETQTSDYEKQAQGFYEETQNFTNYYGDDLPF